MRKQSGTLLQSSGCAWHICTVYTLEVQYLETRLPLTKWQGTICCKRQSTIPSNTSLKTIKFNWLYIYTLRLSAMLLCIQTHQSVKSILEGILEGHCMQGIISCFCSNFRWRELAFVKEYHFYSHSCRQDWFLTWAIVLE